MSGKEKKGEEALLIGVLGGGVLIREGGPDPERLINLERGCPCATAQKKRKDNDDGGRYLHCHRRNPN